MADTRFRLLKRKEATGVVPAERLFVEEARIGDLVSQEILRINPERFEPVRKLLGLVKQIPGYTIDRCKSVRDYYGSLYFFMARNKDSNDAFKLSKTRVALALDVNPPECGQFYFHELIDPSEEDNVNNLTHLPTSYKETVKRVFPKSSYHSRLEPLYMPRPEEGYFPDRINIRILTHSWKNLF